MDRDSVQRLRFDRRLQRRAGWVEDSDRETHLASLPDVSAKMTTIAEEENTASSKSGAAPPAADVLAAPRRVGFASEGG